MANFQFPIPIKGISEVLPVAVSPADTSGYMNNVFPRDTLERRLRIGQRPGLEKKFSQQISGLEAPIVALLEVTFLD